MTTGFRVTSELIRDAAGNCTRSAAAIDGQLSYTEAESANIRHLQPVDGMKVPGRPGRCRIRWSH
jgi:hypothetical protein